MNLAESIRLAFGNIRSNKLRSVLTMLGIIIGISSVITITTIGTSLKQTISNTFASLGGTNLVSAYVEQVYDEDEGYREVTSEDSFSYEDIMEYREAFKDKLKYLSVTSLVGAGEASGAEYNSKVAVIGTTPDWLSTNKLELLAGRDITDKDNNEVKATAVVSDLFVKYALNGEDPLGKRIEIKLSDGNILKLYVVGVYKYDTRRMGGSRGSESERELATYIMVPITYAIECSAQSSEDSGFLTFDFVTADGTNPKLVAKQTEEYFKENVYADNENVELKCYDLESELSTISTVLDVVTIAISVIAAISLVVGGVGVMNIMLVSVIERTKEIGIRKALGAKNRSIQLQFLTESVVICMIGGFIGIVIGIVNGVLLGKVAAILVEQMASNIGSLLAITITPSVNAIIISVAFSMLTGIVFGSYPAKRAAKLSPIDALRYE